MIEPPGFQDPDGRYTLSSGNAHNWRRAGHLKDGCPKAATSAGVDCTPSTCDCSLGSSPHWYTNYTFIPPGVKPTIGPDSPMRTWFPEGTGFPDNIGGQPPNTPWRAPGTAPLYSPCGISGGNPTGCPPGNPDATNCGAGGFGHGMDMRVLPGNTKPTVWKQGSRVSLQQLPSQRGG